MDKRVKVSKVYEYFVCYDIRRNAREYSCIDCVFAENAECAKTKALDRYLERMDMPCQSAPHRFGTFAIRRDKALKSERFRRFVLQYGWSNFDYHKRGLYFVGKNGDIFPSESGLEFLSMRGLHDYAVVDEVR